MPKPTPAEIMLRFRQQVERKANESASHGESLQELNPLSEIVNEIETGVILVGVLHPDGYPQDDPELYKMAADVTLFFRVVVSNVLKHDGIVSRYFGSTVMCQFGGLLANPEAPHALNALKALSNISAEITSENEQRASVNQERINSGFAVAFGKILGGISGYEKFKSYQLIGGHVYLAIAVAQMAEWGQCFANEEFVTQLGNRTDSFPVQFVRLANGTTHSVYRIIG